MSFTRLAAQPTPALDPGRTDAALYSVASVAPSAVPEPGSPTLLVTGLAGPAYHNSTEWTSGRVLAFCRAAQGRGIGGNLIPKKRLGHVAPRLQTGH